MAIIVFDLMAACNRVWDLLGAATEINHVNVQTVQLWTDKYLNSAITL